MATRMAAYMESCCSSGLPSTAQNLLALHPILVCRCSMKKEYKKNNIVPSAEVREAATGLRELFTRQANGEMVEVDDEQVVDLALATAAAALCAR